MVVHFGSQLKSWLDLNANSCAVIPFLVYATYIGSNFPSVSQATALETTGVSWVGLSGAPHTQKNQIFQVKNDFDQPMGAPHAVRW